MNETKVAMSQKDSVIIYLIGFFVMLAGSVIVTSLLSADTNLYIYICYLFPQIGYIGGVLVYTKYKNIDFNLNIKENVQKNNFKYLIAIFCGAGIFFSALLLNYFLQIFYDIINLDVSVTVPSLNNVWDYLFSLILICILPPIGEELVFRKTMGDGFNKLGTLNTMLICGILFSLSHLNPVQTVYQFILGCILALIYLKTKDIVIPIIIHVINNLLALFLSSLTDPEIWNSLSVLLVCFIAGIIVAGTTLYFILRDTGKNTKKQEKLSSYAIILLVAMLILWLICAFL